MTKHKLGLVIFWMAVIWAFVWGTIGSFSLNAAMSHLTLDQLNQTMWSSTRPLHIIWAIGGVPVAAILAAIGVLLIAGAKGSTVWKYGVGMTLAFLAAMFSVRTLGHIAPLFGIGGTLIILLFLGILWLWAKERMALGDTNPAATDFRLVGYVFWVIVAWFVCGAAARPFLPDMQSVKPLSPIYIMVLMVLGWFFLFLSHYKARQPEDR
jgi:hypothetical protein